MHPYLKAIALGYLAILGLRGLYEAMLILGWAFSGTQPWRDALKQVRTDLVFRVQMAVGGFAGFAWYVHQLG